MKDLNTLAISLQIARKNTLKNFDKIALTRDATKLVARLFYNPDCISLVNLDDLIVDGQIPLKDLSRYMLTAAPSTLANYANKHHKVLLHHTDIINCFAIDHQQAVKDNEIDLIYNPEYALSHILLSGRIIKIYEIDHQKFADILHYNPKSSSPKIMTGSAIYEVAESRSALTNTSGVGPACPPVAELREVGALMFKKVLIPKDLEVKKGDLVWHHFGIGIDKYNGESQITAKQFDSPFFRLLDSKTSRLEIDFSDKKIFHRDILGKILAEQKNLKNKKRIISDPSISKIKLPTDSKIKFIH